MKKLFLFAFTIFFCLQSFSQVGFEKGYYKDNNGVLHQGFIKNYDWRLNPESIEFKSSEDSEIINVRKEYIEEFQIEKTLKFKRFQVDIDRSSDSEKWLSDQRDPEFSQETLLLKVLLEGAANLYQYTDTNIDRFFYSTVDLPLQQLVSKRFQVSNTIRANSRFRQQLLNDLNCGQTTTETVKNLKYSKVQLLKYFEEFNKCEGSTFQKYDGRTRGILNFKIKAGVDLLNLNIVKEDVYYQIGRNIQFEDDINPRFGFELEYVLPFNKNKWAVFTDPSYQQFSIEGILSYNHSIPYNKPSVEIRSRSVAVPLGLRHYIFLGDQSGIFLNAAYAFNYYFENELSSSNERIVREVEFTNKSHSIDLGIGYHYKNKYSLEAKYGSGRDIFSDYSLWKSGGSSVISIIMGYKIF